MRIPILFAGVRCSALAHRVLVALLLVIFCLGGLALGQARLIAPDGAAKDYFGDGAAVSGNVAVIAAPGDDGLRGSVYIYRHDGTAWTCEDKLISQDAVRVDEVFGIGVDVSDSPSGKVVVVGEVWGDRGATWPGAVWVFRNSGIGWDSEGKIYASDAADYDHFGFRVAISGDLMVASAPNDDDKGPSSGSAYVFRHNGTSWLEEYKIVPTDSAAGDQVGTSLAMFSAGGATRVVIGAPHQNQDAGALWVYRQNGTSWIQEGLKLTAPAGDANPGDWLGGGYLSMSGNVLVAGARNDDERGVNAGAAYVFRFDGSAWNLEQKLTASDAAPGARFGQATVSGDLILVGAAGDAAGKGAAYAFRYDPLAVIGSRWTEMAKLTAFDGASGDAFAATALDRGMALVGAYYDDNVKGIDAGAVYPFQVNNTPVGLTVGVNPLDPSTGISPVIVTFPAVTQAGSTAMASTTSGPPLSSGFEPGTPPTYYEVTTTATFTGLVTICIDYSATKYGSTSLKLLQYENSTWKDVTTSHNTSTKIICGVVSTLSPLVVVESADPVAMINQLIAAVTGLNLKWGIQNGLDAKLDAAAKALSDVKAKNDVAAVNALGAFINAVEAQSGKMIPANDAAVLVAAARDIVDLLTGS